MKNKMRAKGRHPWRPPFGHAVRVLFRTWRNSEWYLLPLLALLPLGSTTVAAEDEQQPSVELLEFLGSWETKDGDWIDPVSFLSMLQSGDDSQKQQQAQSEGKQND